MLIHFFNGNNAHPKFVLKCRKSDFDGYLDDDVILNSGTPKSSSHPINIELYETNVSPFAYMYESMLCSTIFVET